jgi:hypothetical protein
LQHSWRSPFCSHRGAASSALSRQVSRWGDAPSHILTNGERGGGGAALGLFGWKVTAIHRDRLFWPSSVV